MISNIMGLAPEDEPEQPTIFGDLRKKLVDEFTSEVSEFSDNFERLKVFLRVRPFTSEERLAQKQSCLSIENEHYVTAVAPKDSNNFKNNSHCGSKNVQKFKFSKIFKEDSDQLQFYNGTVRSLVEDFLTGQNCLVFAYGVTNAGKTYTVQGNPKNPGILPRTLETIFNHVNGKQWRGLDLKPKMFLDVVKLSPRSENDEKNKKENLLRMATFDDSDTSSVLADSGRESCPLDVTERSHDSDINDEELLHSTQLNETAYGDQIKYSVWVSFAEVYNEQVFDLLEAPTLKKRTLLKLGEDKHGNPYIRGLTEVNVTSTEEALKLMTIGQKNLRKASTKLNHNSSRSHCIFNIKLLRVVNRDNPSVAKVTMLSLCDLAGSERACKTNSTGDRLKEAGNINTSLLTLGRCIETMRSNQLKKDLLPRMIPYRDSKLTRLFQGFFSGRGKAVMIVNVNKCSTLFDETLQVFKFSAVAKQVVIQQKAEKPVQITISPVLPVKPLSHMERASIPWADDVHEISRANYSHRLSAADETMEDEEISERERGLLDIIDNCKKAIAYMKESLAKEKKDRMLDEIRLRDEITKELMEQFVAIEKNYSEKVQVSRLLAEEATDSKITKMLESLNPSKKRQHEEVESDEEMVPLHALEESQNKIKQCELQIQELTQRLESTKKQMRRMTTDNSKLACENTCLQFQVSDMLQVPAAPKAEPLSDNLEQANVLNKLTSMLKTTQDKLKEKESEVYELEEQLQEAGETFHQHQQQIDSLNEMVKQLRNSNKMPSDCEVCKARSENTWQLRPDMKNQADPNTNQKDFEERERALINGYNAEIGKYKGLVSQLRLQLAHSKSSGPHLSPTKDPSGKSRENPLNQAQLKQYLLRQIKRLQDELDKNSQSVAEVTQALDLKKAAEIDLEQRLAYETAGHRQAKALVSELKKKVKRLGERCRSASFEAEKTFAAIESELYFIESQSVNVKEELSEQESFQSAIESSFELTKAETEEKAASGKEDQSVDTAVIEGASVEPKKKANKNAPGGNGSNFRLDPACLEQKIITKNMEIVRLQEKLLVQTKLERDLKELTSKNEELVNQLKDMSQLQSEIKKKTSLIRGLEDKLKTTEVLEVEVESQSLVIQRLQAAVDERSVLLAKLQNSPSRTSSNGSSPVSDRKMEELETVMLGLREMVDRSTQELSQKDEKIQILSKEKKRCMESLENEVRSLKAGTVSLEEELQNLKKEKEAFEVLKNTLGEELEKLKVENGTISESKNSLGKELEDSKKVNKEICDLKNSLEKNLGNLKLENKTINDLKNSLEKELEKTQKEKEEISNFKNSLEKNLESLKLENKTINDLKNSLEKELENLKAEQSTVSDLKNSLEKDLEISKTEVLDLKNSLSKELESLKAENELISSARNSLEKDLEDSAEEKKRISDIKNSLEKEIQNLKEENETILKQKESLHSELLSVKSELEAKSTEMVSLKSSLLSKESDGEKSNIKATNELKNSLALAKMAQRELEENLATKKKELRAKDTELNKMSELLETKKQENLDLESKLTVLSKKQEATKNETSPKSELERKEESSDNVQRETRERSSGPQGEMVEALKEEVHTLEKSLEDNVQAREKLLIEISGLVSSLSEKDRQIAELKNEKDKDEDTLKTSTQVTIDEGKSVAQLEADLDAEKQRCEELTVKLEIVKLEIVNKEVERLKSVDDHTLTTDGPCSQVKAPETIGKDDNVQKQTSNDLGQEATPLQTELQKVRNLLDIERSENETLQFELAAANARLDELKTDCDNEKNISFNLKYELEDVKGSLSEVLDSFDQINQKKNDAFVDNKEMKMTGEVNQKLMDGLEPETRQIVEDLQEQIKCWQTKHEELSLELISERQKLLDAQNCRSENFYLRRENNKLQKEVSSAQKQMHELESRQEIQLITMETDQMTKKLIEDRKKSEEQHLRSDLELLRDELSAAQEKLKSYEELEAEVKQLREKVPSPDETKDTAQVTTVSLEVVDQTPIREEVRLDQKYKYESRKDSEDKENVEEKKDECKDIDNLGYEKMRQEMAVLSRELAAAQKEAQYLQDKVEANEKVGGLASTPLLETKVGSNRQLRREKIQAESAKMEAEFALKIAKEEIESLTKRLEKYEKRVSLETDPKLDSAEELKKAQKEILHLKNKVGEYEAKISEPKDKAVIGKSEELNKELQKLSKEMQDLETSIKEEKAKVTKLNDDLSQKRCVIDVLKESLKEQDDMMIGFEKLLDQKDETIKKLNFELSEERKFRHEQKENVISPRPSLEKEKLKTVVSNQTETIQVLSQRNTQQELNCETIRNEMQNMKMSLTIIAAERDSLRKRLHLVETACKCHNQNNNNSNKVTAQSPKAKSPQTSSNAVKEKKNIVLGNLTPSSDTQYWHQQKALVVESIHKAADRRRLQSENVENITPKLLLASPACQTTRSVKRLSGPHPDTGSCTRKKVCLSPASDQSSSPAPEKSPTGSGTPKTEYIEIDVTPPVAAKALKKNRKRKPLELTSQDSLLNSSKLSISTKSLSLCRKANISDEEPSGGQDIPAETPVRPNRRSKSIANKKIKEMSTNTKGTSPINKKIKPVDEVKTSASDDQMSDSSLEKGKTAMSRFKNLTNSFRSSSFRGAKTLLTSPRTWSMKDTSKKETPGSPKSPWNPSTRAVLSSSKKTNAILNTSDADSNSHRELRNILTDVPTGPQRKRRLYKEEIIGPMSYEGQIMKTRAVTTVRPKEDVFSIVRQQLRGRHK